MFSFVGRLFGGGERSQSGDVDASPLAPARQVAGDLRAPAPGYQTDAGERAGGEEGARSPSAPEDEDGPGRRIIVQLSPKRLLAERRARVAEYCARVPAAGARDKLELKQGNLRTAEEVFAAKGQVMPAGFPSGPFASHLEAKAQIAAFCRDPKTGGGAHGVVWGKLEQGCSTHGPRRALICHQHGAAQSSCKWRLTLEETADGWVNYSQYGVHNHTLAASVAEANAHNTMRDIPPELLSIAKDMVASGIPPAAVDRFLRHQVELRKETPTWTYQDVYTATGASTKQRAADATGFAELLWKREQEEGLFSRWQTDEFGCLSRVFFVMPDAHEIVAIDPDNLTVVFDTKARTLAVALSHTCVLATALTHPFPSLPSARSSAPITRGSRWLPSSRWMRRGRPRRSLTPFC
jgi:hypothetical protein